MTTMDYIGLDVHKNTISYCVKDVSGRVQQEGQVGSTRRELDCSMKTLPQPWTVAMEATIFSGWIYDASHIDLGGVVKEVVIDVRKFPELASGHITDAKLVPLGTVAKARSHGISRSRLLSSTRVAAVPSRPGSSCRQRCCREAWMHGVLQVAQPSLWSGGPWSMGRQVRTVAGSLVMMPLALVFFISPYSLLGTALVGAWLIFAGGSDTCMMAPLLGHMPWNRPAQVTK
jgi:hypothetical protein